MGNFPKSILEIILVITLFNVLAVAVHSSLAYPKVRRDETIVDDYHGIKVKDPYRWLEDPESEQVSEFIGAQNELSSSYLSDCQQRQQFKDRLNELWAFPKFGRPEKIGSRYFYFAQQRGGEVLYTQGSKEATPKSLIDPGVNGVLAFPHFGVSQDGELVAYREVVLTREGIPHETGNLKILNVTTGSIYPETLEDIRNYQIAWDGESRGFFYFLHKKIGLSSEETEDNPKFYIYYHKVGTEATSDVLAIDYSDFVDEPDIVDMEISQDGQYLLLRTKTYKPTNDKARGVTKSVSTFYTAVVTKFTESDGLRRLKLVPMVTKENTPLMKYIANTGSLFYFRSRTGTKNYKVIEIDLLNPSEEKWRTAIEENRNYVLQATAAVDKSRVVLSYTSKKLNSYVEIRDLKNGSLIRTFPLEFGELLSFSGHIDDSEVLFRSTKLEGLPELFYFDVRDPNGPMKKLVQQPPLSSYNSSDYVTEVVTYPGADGESDVEMVLTYPKGLKRDGSAHAFIVEREFDLDFHFRIYFSYMKDFNAVVAFPHLEENGDEFRDSAQDDYIGAAEYLVKNGYSSGPKIITRGQNTFGLFVASAINKRPELFGSAILSLVAFDMLRFDAVINGSAGPDISEFEENFKRTYKISPLHNIRLPSNESVQYPAILIPTPNVYPIPLAFKYLSELQHTLGNETRQTNPFLMRVAPEPRESDVRNFQKYHIARETAVRCFFEKTTGLRLST